MGVWPRHPLTVKAPSALCLPLLSMGEVVGYSGFLAGFLSMESLGPQLHYMSDLPYAGKTVGRDVGNNLNEGEE